MLKNLTLQPQYHSLHPNVDNLNVMSYSQNSGTIDIKISIELTPDWKPKSKNESPPESMLYISDKINRSLKYYNPHHMPAKDIFHNTVKIGLEKEGWEITSDPLYLDFGGIEIYIDLAAEKLIAAEREGKKIAVEIKSFIGSSAISEFHKALGQFINYRAVLSQKEADRIMYLAVPKTTYETFFKLELIQLVTKTQNIKLIVYNPNKEEIEQWIN